MGPLCAEQNVGNLRTWTFGNSGTPVRRTKRRKYQKLYFHKFWDSCAQNKASEIAKQMDVQEFWDSCAQNRTSEITKTWLSGIMGLLCADQDVGNIKNGLSGILGLLGAEQDVGNLKKCTSKSSGIPVRRTRRRKFQKLHFQEFYDSCAQTKTSEISKNALTKIVELLRAEQDVGNFKR